MEKDKIIEFLQGRLPLKKLMASLDIESYQKSSAKGGSFTFQNSIQSFYFSNEHLMKLIHNFVLQEISIDELSYLLDYIDLQEENWEYENKSFVEELSLVCNLSPR